MSELGSPTESSLDAPKSIYAAYASVAAASGSSGINNENLVSVTVPDSTS